MNHLIRHEQFSKLFPILFKTTIWRICYYVFLFGTDCFIQLQGLLKNKDRKLAQTFNSYFRHIDDALSLRNSRLGEYLHHIYPNDRFSFYFDHHIIIDNRGRLKTNSTTNVMTSLLQQSSSLSSVTIFQHHQRMELTFHNSYIFLELVPVQ